MQNRLVVYKDGRVDLSFPVTGAGVRIGREGDNHVQLVSPEVSKHHATLTRTGGGWLVRDTQSRNGVLVNGQRVRESPVRDGDRIAIGPYELVFETGSGPARGPAHVVVDLSSDTADRTLVQQPVAPAKGA